MTLFPFFDLPDHIQIAAACVAVGFLLGPARHFRDRPEKALKIGAFMSLGLVAAVVVPWVFARTDGMFDAFAPLQGFVVLAVILGLKGLLRFETKQKG